MLIRYFVLGCKVWKDHVQSWKMKGEFYTYKWCAFMTYEGVMGITNENNIYYVAFI